MDLEQLDRELDEQLAAVMRAAEERARRRRDEVGDAVTAENAGAVVQAAMVELERSRPEAAAFFRQMENEVRRGDRALLRNEFRSVNGSVNVAGLTKRLTEHDHGRRARRRPREHRVRSATRRGPPRDEDPEPDLAPRAAA